VAVLNHSKCCRSQAAAFDEIFNLIVGALTILQIVLVDAPSSLAKR